MMFKGNVLTTKSSLDKLNIISLPFLFAKIFLTLLSSIEKDLTLYLNETFLSMPFLIFSQMTLSPLIG